LKFEVLNLEKKMEEWEWEIENFVYLLNNGHKKMLD